MSAALLAVLDVLHAVVELPGVLLGARLGLDETGRGFLLFTALLWTVSGWFAGGYLATGS